MTPGVIVVPNYIATRGAENVVMVAGVRCLLYRLPGHPPIWFLTPMLESRSDGASTRSVERPSDAKLLADFLDLLHRDRSGAT